MLELITPFAIMVGIVFGAFTLYYVGYITGRKDAMNKLITQVVKRVGAEDFEHLVQLVEEAAETENLLKSEQKRLIETILKEAKR